MALDISVINGALVLSDGGEVLEQLQAPVHVYEYRPNANLNRPENLKLYDERNRQFEVELADVATISGAPFAGTFEDLAAAVSALISTVNNPPPALAPDAATLTEQQTQTAELLTANIKLGGIDQNIQLSKQQRQTPVHEIIGQGTAVLIKEYQDLSEIEFEVYDGTAVVEVIDTLGAPYAVTFPISGTNSTITGGAWRFDQVITNTFFGQQRIKIDATNGKVYVKTLK